jgi:hypothetical protein
MVLARSDLGPGASECNTLDLLNLSRQQVVLEALRNAVQIFSNNQPCRVEPEQKS